MRPAEVRVLATCPHVVSNISQIVECVEMFPEDQRYRVEWFGNLHFDDLVWHQSLV